MKLLAYSVMWLFIGLVSSYDAYLNLRYPVTALTEQNPIARWILESSGDDLPLLIGLKFAGTLIGLGILVLCYARRQARALLAASAVAAMQAAVLVYLTDGLTMFR